MMNLLSMLKKWMNTSDLISILRHYFQKSRMSDSPPPFSSNSKPTLSDDLTYGEQEIAFIAASMHTRRAFVSNVVGVLLKRYEFITDVIASEICERETVDVDIEWHDVVIENEGVMFIGKVTPKIGTIVGVREGILIEVTKEIAPNLSNLVIFSIAVNDLKKLNDQSQVERLIRFTIAKNEYIPIQTDADFERLDDFDYEGFDFDALTDDQLSALHQTMGILSTQEQKPRIC